MDKHTHDKRDRKDKALPSPKNMRSPVRSPGKSKGKREEKKHGHGRYNWGPVIDTTPLNDEECDDPRDTVLQVTEYKREA